MFGNLKQKLLGTTGNMKEAMRPSTPSQSPLTQPEGTVNPTQPKPPPGTPPWTVNPQPPSPSMQGVGSPGSLSGMVPGGDLDRFRQRDFGAQHQQVAPPAAGYNPNVIMGPQQQAPVHPGTGTFPEQQPQIPYFPGNGTFPWENNVSPWMGMGGGY